MAIVALFVVCIAVQCGFAVFFAGRIGSLRRWEPVAYPTQPVSVVICARNEASLLRAYLPAILQQAYTDASGRPNYEVVVVDDGSTDDTASVLAELREQYAHLKYVAIPVHEARGKKNALRMGVTAAQHDMLLLTDADCRPASPQWLALMVAPLAAGRELALGYGAYERTTDNALNSFVQWETAHTYMQYAAYAAAGMPYMGVGRNLACTRQVLLAAMQHPIWQRLPSGDDDMLVRVAGTPTNTAVVCERDAFTYTPAKNTWGEWARQKQRHMSTGKYYKWYIKLLLGSYAATHAGMWLGAVWLFVAGWWGYAVPVITVRMLMAYTAWDRTNKRLGQNVNFVTWLVGDIGWMMYNFALLPYITWKNKTSWK
ncbi:glycosyltransferase [Nemorincola caseinilytica]|uniref:Glycosyltransferase n=1 Tax=Nemorincola caseinilytica TaxID=2054315 RepID=A0ABP8N0M1_9BACT